MEVRRFEYETLLELAGGLIPGDNLISWNVAGASYHLQIRPQDQPYLCFTIQGRVSAPVSMLFGLAVAPFTWTKFCRP